MSIYNRIERTETCWLWTGAKNMDGYGVVRSEGKQKRAHRVVYEEVNGKIPDGLHCEHRCRVRSCVNPAHIELVDNVTNVMRGQSLAARNARKTRCAKGHPYSKANTRITPRGWRVCRQCKRAWSKAERGRT